MPEPQIIYGTPVVNGLAYAKAKWVKHYPLPPATTRLIPADQRENEVQKYRQAYKKVSSRLQARAQEMIGTTSDVLAAEAELVQDVGFVKMVITAIRKGTPAEQAVIKTTDSFCAMFEKAGGLMAERTTDLKDLCLRVVAEILDQPEPGIIHSDQPIVLFADDLAPADTSGLDPDNILALVTEQGGPTSHTSIIARQLGLPCIVAARNLSTIPDDEQVFIDASKGTIQRGIPGEQVAELVESDRAYRESVHTWQGPAQLKSGEAVELLANVQDGPGARKAADSPAQGVGLFRTELCFLNSLTEPSIEQQTRIYQGVLEAFADSKVIVRTLDAGSDKPVSWASVDEEPNPALGVRGLRTSGIDQGLFFRQLDAIAQAVENTAHRETWVMVPMVSTLAEAKWVAQMIRQRGLKAGIMVEVPAVVIQIDQFLAEVDFVSIGTNDLTQYVMAADRMNANLATYTDPWQPAALNLISQVAQAGIRHGKPVGVCGEAAADPVLATVLVGMGVSSLSCASSALPAVGTQLEYVTLSDCQQAAREAIWARDPGDARLKARQALKLPF